MTLKDDLENMKIASDVLLNVKENPKLARAIENIVLRLAKKIVTKIPEVSKKK